MLRNLEISLAECELLTEVREILSETDIDIDHTQSLAAGLARTWAWFLQDVCLVLTPCPHSPFPQSCCFCVRQSRRRLTSMLLSRSGCGALLSV